MKDRIEWLVTCEHAGNRIPKRYAALFQKELLSSHKGFDVGAKEYASFLGVSLGAKLFCGRWSRQLVDLNRSQGSPHLFSDPVRALPETEKETIIRKYYLPYREAVQNYVEGLIQRKKRVIHLSCHSFTPHLHGRERLMDVGLLYDPKKQGEKVLARALSEDLRKNTSLSLRLNAPYRGTSDGLTSALRLCFSPKRYIGIEIEINQGMLGNPLWKYLWLPSLFHSLQGAEHICL